MDRGFPAWRKQQNRIPVALGLKELPHDSRAHEPGRFGLHFLNIVEQLECLRVAFAEQLLKISTEAEMPPIKHEGIDIAPHFRKVRNVAYLPVERRRGRNRDIDPDFRASRRGWRQGRHW